MSDEFLDEHYERIGAIKGFVRKPRLLESGSVVQFFVPSDSEDVDAVLALALKKYQDAEVMVTVHLLKNQDGASMAKKDPGPTYGEFARKVYRRGYFNSHRVRQAIRKSCVGALVRFEGMPNDQHDWATIFAREHGQERFGEIPPAVFIDWIEGCGLDVPSWMNEEVDGGEDGARD